MSYLAGSRFEGVSIMGRGGTRPYRQEGFARLDYQVNMGCRPAFCTRRGLAPKICSKSETPHAGNGHRNMTLPDRGGEMGKCLGYLSGLMNFLVHLPRGVRFSLRG